MADYIPEVRPTWPNYSASNKPIGSSDTTLGKDQFLKILIAQIQNQDPANPLQDTEFISQMAQFTSLEQMMNISTSLDRLNNSIGLSSSLIGKSVAWEIQSTDDESVLKSGIVSAIALIDGEMFVVVGEEEIALSRIIAVMNPSDPPEEEGEQQP